MDSNLVYVGMDIAKATLDLCALSAQHPQRRQFTNNPCGHRALLRWLASLLIADEVLTGFGRTGTMFACEQEEVVPDFMALAKGLTGGYLPLAATLTTEEIFNAFLGDYAEFKTFFHGHSYTGNQLGCAAALANLKVFEQERTLENLAARISALKSGLDRCLALPHVGEVRHIGMIGAVELFKDPRAREPFPLTDRVGARVCEAMRRGGVLTRPIGNTVVLMPPYCISAQQLDRLMQVTAAAIASVFGKV